MQNSDSIQDWMTSERLYEEYLFFYILILTFIAAIGLFTLGFEITGFSLQQNLLCNFLWFLMLAVAMSFTPFWYRLIFGTNARLQKRSAEIEEQVSKIKDPVKRQAIQQHLANGGELPPRKLQIWSLIFLGWCALFEMFFVSSWVKDMALVWQPDWVDWVINWAIDNTTVEPLNVDRKLFILYFSHDDFSYFDYTSENDFFYSPFGQSVMLFQVWRFIIFFPVLTALIILLWKPIDWLGMDNINPRYLKVNSVKGCVKFIWLSILTFFMLLMLWGGVLGLLQSIRALSLFSVVSKAMWLDSFWKNVIFIFMIFALKLLVGWLVFWKNVFHSIKGKLL